MPSYMTSSPIEMSNSLASSVVSDIQTKGGPSLPTTSREKEETFTIHKRTCSSGRIRNLRSGLPESVERDLPQGEHPMEFFVTDYVVALNGFNAPYREARLEEKEANWMVAQQTTPRRSSADHRRPMRRPSGLFGQPSELPFSAPVCNANSHEPCAVLP